MIVRAIFMFIAFFLICNIEICQAQNSSNSTSNSTGNCTVESITVIINGKNFKVNFDSCTGTQTNVTNGTDIQGRYVFNVNMITSSETVNVRNDNMGGGKGGNSNNNNNILFSPKVQSGQYSPSISNANKNAPGAGGFDNNNNVVSGGGNTNGSISVNNNNGKPGASRGFGSFGDLENIDMSPNNFYGRLLGGRPSPFSSGRMGGRNNRPNINDNNNNNENSDGTINNGSGTPAKNNDSPVRNRFQNGRIQDSRFTRFRQRPGLSGK